MYSYCYLLEIYVILFKLSILLTRYIRCSYIDSFVSAGYQLEVVLGSGQKVLVISIQCHVAIKLLVLKFNYKYNLAAVFLYREDGVIFG